MLTNGLQTKEQKVDVKYPVLTGHVIDIYK